MIDGDKVYWGGGCHRDALVDWKYGGIGVFLELKMLFDVWAWFRRMTSTEKLYRVVYEFVRFLRTACIISKSRGNEKDVYNYIADPGVIMRTYL